MKRRHFLKQSSIAAVGGLLAHHLPLHAGKGIFHPSPRHVVICVVAGLEKSDFEKLFVSTGSKAVLNSGRICEMRYNGAAAGHRMALESILHGEYLAESACGKQSLVESPLLLHPNGKKYLVTSDRVFLKTPGYTEAPGSATHLLVSCVPNQGESPLVKGTKANFSIVSSDNRNVGMASGLRNEIIESNDAYHRRLLFYSEDLLVAETACAILRRESPTVLVSHFMGADVAHGDASQAQTNIRHISTGIQRIWEAVESHPGMKGNTLLVVLPDFGRNGFHNSMVDGNGNYGTDHSISDQNTTHIACLFASNDPHFDLSRIQTRIVQSTDIYSVAQLFLKGKKHFGWPRKDLSEQA